MRKSSVHFKQVANASVSIAHSTRTEETEPAYLLPKEHRLGNVIVPGSMSNIDLGLEFTRAKDSMTGQAKARGSSPFWEGVIVLDGTDFKAQTAALQSWKKEYEKATGQRVLHMAIHGDEGFINSAGKPEYNIHAHVIVNRLNDKGRVIKLERKQLSVVQDLTAKSLGMQRGETLEDRNGMRGRKHLSHREFKAQANEKRLDAEHNIAAIKTLQERIDRLTPQANKLHGLRQDLAGEPERLRLALVAEKYRLDREEFKRLNAEAAEAGLDKPKSQKDYQKLKKEHDDNVEKLKTSNEKVEEMEKKIIDQDAELVDVKAKFATMATEYQAHLDAGKPAAEFVPGTTPDPLPSQSNNQEVDEFFAKHQDVLQATKAEAAYGSVVERAGSHALLHIGRGRHVIHDFGAVQAVPPVGKSADKSGPGNQR